MMNNGRIRVAAVAVVWPHGDGGESSQGVQEAQAVLKNVLV